MKDPFRPEAGKAGLLDMTRRFLTNLERMPVHLGEVITVEKKVWLVPFSRSRPRATERALDIVLATLGALIVLGLLLQLARQQWIVPLYVMFTIAAICLTPWQVQLVRYLTPLSPCLALALFTALLHLGKMSSRVLPRAGRTTGVLAIAVSGSILLQQAIVYYQAHTSWLDDITYNARSGGTARHRAFGYFQSERDLNAGLDWLMERAEPGEVVAASIPAWVYLRTGLESVMPPFEAKPERAQAQLDSVPVTYLFLEQENFTINGRTTSEYVAPVILHHPDLWQPVYSTPDEKFKIFRRSRVR